MDFNETVQVLVDIQKEYLKLNKMKDRIIILLIVLMFAEAVIGYSGFVWFESQFDYVAEETTTTTETISNEDNDTIDVHSEGENAEATYIEGDQYNDNSKHEEGGAD